MGKMWTSEGRGRIGGGSGEVGNEGRVGSGSLDGRRRGDFGDLLPFRVWEQWNKIL